MDSKCWLTPEQAPAVLLVVVAVGIVVAVALVAVAAAGEVVAEVVVAVAVVDRSTATLVVSDQPFPPLQCCWY